MINNNVNHENSIKRIVRLILKGLIPIVLYACGQSIGYKDVGSEIRYYSSTTPDWFALRFW